MKERHPRHLDCQLTGIICDRIRDASFTTRVRFRFERRFGDPERARRLNRSVAPLEDTRIYYLFQMRRGMREVLGVWPNGQVHIGACRSRGGHSRGRLAAGARVG